MKIALVHDFLTQRGGAERVLEELHNLFPRAPVYTLVYDEQKTQGHYRGWDIRTSFIQHLPGGVKRYKWYLPLMPAAIEAFDLSEYDVVLSDASAFAKGVKIGPGVKHLCYCHTPTRYLWQDRLEYVSAIPYPWVVKLSLRPVLAALRWWDKRAAKRPDVMIANSEEVARRIKKYYSRTADAIIYPPVDTEFFSPYPAAVGSRKAGYFLAAGRLEPYKRVDLAIEACTKLGLPLKVAGSGSMFERLRKQAGSNVEFLGRVSDEELLKLYQHARAFIFPAREDAGMMIVESLACGTPVIAFRGGGALEFIKPGVNGEFFDTRSAESLMQALQQFDSTRYDALTVAATAKPFDKSVFRKRILELLSHFSPPREEACLAESRRG